MSSMLYIILQTTKIDCLMHTSYYGSIWWQQCRTIFTSRFM